MFLVMITAHNVSPFLEHLVTSLVRQSFPDWQAVFVDDASTDDTLSRLQTLVRHHDVERKFTVLPSAERRYKAFHVYQTLRSHGGDDDIVVMLDGDDWFAVDHALERLHQEYLQGWEVVWSNWRGSDGSAGTSYYLHPFLSPRQQPFVSSHVFTFKKELFRGVDERDLQDDQGNWFWAGCDVALAWPILGQTIRRKYVAEVLHIYNRHNPLSLDKQGGGLQPYVSSAQAQTAQTLGRRPDKPLVVDQEFFAAHIYDFAQAATLSERFLTRVELRSVLSSTAQRW